MIADIVLLSSNITETHAMVSDIVILEGGIFSQLIKNEPLQSGVVKTELISSLIDYQV